MTTVANCKFKNIRDTLAQELKCDLDYLACVGYTHNVYIKKDSCDWRDANEQYGFI